MYLYDLNSYIKTDSTLITLSNKDTVTIEPAVGGQETEAPVILWWYIPGRHDKWIDGWRDDIVRYMVLDDDAERCIAVGERIIALLNRGPDIRTAVSSFGYTGLNSLLVKGEFMGPSIRDGWFQFKIEAEVSWLPTSAIF
jgi:hypothetical protein